MDIDSNPERVSNLREFADNYDWSGLEFPVFESLKPRIIFLLTCWV